MNTIIRCAAGLAAVLATAVVLADRAVQIRSVDFTTGLVELHNFGTSDVPLDGWRFCSHSELMRFQYSSSTGLNGFTIEAGTSLFVHFNNDAPGGPDSVNRSALGSFAQPLDPIGAYGLQIYFPPVSFGNPASVGDHLQWSEGGLDNTTADERSDEAELGGLWTDQNLWISTTAVSERINLLDTTGGILHGPSDYEVIEPGDPNEPNDPNDPNSPGCDPACSSDLDGDCFVDLTDLGVLLANFGNPFDLTDLGVMLAQFGNDCSKP